MRPTPGERAITYWAILILILIGILLIQLYATTPNPT